MVFIPSFHFKTIYKGIFQPVANATVKQLPSISTTPTAGTNDERYRQQQRQLLLQSNTAHQLLQRDGGLQHAKTTRQLHTQVGKTALAAASSSSTSSHSAASTASSTSSSSSTSACVASTQPSSSITTTSATRQSVSFQVERTSSHQLPVYTDYKNGSHIQTILRKFSGDSEALAADVRHELGPHAVVEARPGKLVIQGQYSRQLKEWLTRIGF